MAIVRKSSTSLQIRRQVAFAGAVAVLVAACATGSGASAPQVAPSASPSASTDASASTGGVTIAPIGAPVAAPGSGGSGVVVTSGGAMSGQAIAYPYPGYPGTPGLAPDHTIVVTGFGQAPLAPDQSNRAATQQVALKAALADAKSQADLVASATGVTIAGVLSVSVSSSQGFIGPIPMMVGGAAPVGPSSGGSVAPAPAQPPIAPMPELDVTVTVAYRIG